MGKRAKRYYTVYLCKTDEVIAQGTAEECAKQMGFSQANSFFSSLVKHKNGKAHKYIFVSDADELEEVPGRAELKRQIYKDFLKGVTWEDMSHKYGYSVSMLKKCVSSMRPTTAQVLKEWDMIHEKYGRR